MFDKVYHINNDTFEVSIGKILKSNSKGIIREPSDIIYVQFEDDSKKTMRAKELSFDDRSAINYLIDHSTNNNREQINKAMETIAVDVLGDIFNDIKEGIFIPGDDNDEDYKILKGYAGYKFYRDDINYYMKILKRL